MATHFVPLLFWLCHLWSITFAETGVKTLLDPDSGEPVMPVNIRIVDPSPGTPPKIQLLKEGASTEYCITFESIFEANSYDSTTGNYGYVANSQVILNSNSSDCVLSDVDDNTANIVCAIGNSTSTLTFTVDSAVQKDSGGTETGAKYTLSLADYTWVSADAGAQLVLVHSFETCTTSSRRLLSNSAGPALAGDASGDSDEADFGLSSFDIDGQAYDDCGDGTKTKIDSSLLLVEGSDKVHIVFEHFKCTLSMDPFFGLDNELYGYFTRETHDGPFFCTPCVIIMAIGIVLFVLFFVIVMCIYKKRNAQTAEPQKKDDVEMQSGRTEDAVKSLETNEITTPLNDDDDVKEADGGDNEAYKD
eukprot:110663_1